MSAQLAGFAAACFQSSFFDGIWIRDILKTGQPGKKADCKQQRVPVDGFRITDAGLGDGNRNGFGGRLAVNRSTATDP